MVRIRHDAFYHMPPGRRLGEHIILGENAASCGRYWPDDCSHPNGLAALKAHLADRHEIRPRSEPYTDVPLPHRLRSGGTCGRATARAGPAAGDLRRERLRIQGARRVAVVGDAGCISNGLLCFPGFQNAAFFTDLIEGLTPAWVADRCSCWDYRSYGSVSTAPRAPAFADASRA